MAGARAGNVTRRNVVQPVAPKLALISSSVSSNACTRASNTRSVYGREITMCPAKTKNKLFSRSTARISSSNAKPRINQGILMGIITKLRASCLYRSRRTRCPKIKSVPSTMQTSPVAKASNREFRAAISNAESPASS